jgi:hypothetical protein
MKSDMIRLVDENLPKRPRAATNRKGILEELIRGLCRIVVMPLLGNLDLVSVDLKMPDAFIYFISTLAYHRIIT